MTTLEELKSKCVQARQFAELFETNTLKQEYKKAEADYLYAERLLGFVDVNLN